MVNEIKGSILMERIMRYEYMHFREKESLFVVNLFLSPTYIHTLAVC
jgi:hypothetical protein